MLARNRRLVVALVMASAGATLALRPAAPAAADPGCLPNAASFHPADRPDITISVPACPAPAAPGCQPAAAVGDDGAAHPIDGTGPAVRECAAAAPATAARRPVKPLRKRCTTRWASGRDSNGRWVRRPWHRGRWHKVTTCRRAGG